MKVVFRTDASIEIGSGHVMRCLTLADILAKRGYHCSFICREHPGHLGSMIQHRGYAINLLPMAGQKPLIGKSHTEHTHWLGVSWQQDAKECQPLLQALQPEWLVVDHYALDEQWEQACHTYCQHLAVIDDLADRPHDCQLLLDQTYSRTPEAYHSLTPEHCLHLTGSEFALLRPEFSHWRTSSLKRRGHAYSHNPQLKQILVNLGGVDKDNFTGQVLQALSQCHLPTDCCITVVMGQTAPHKALVQQQASKLPYQCEVLSSVNNMAELMSRADLAIGAAGSTSWERCTLGLPSIQLTIAENQQTIARQLDAIGATVSLSSVEAINDDLLNQVQQKSRRLTLVSRFICDGKGAEHAANALTGGHQFAQSLQLCPVTAQDCAFTLSLQTPSVRKYFKNSAVPTEQEHNRWFNAILRSDSQYLFIIKSGKQPVGTIRADLIDEDALEISIIIHHHFTGKGYAKQAIGLLTDALPDYEKKAVVHQQNIASAKAFEYNGFTLTDRRNSFLEYRLK